MKPELTGLAYDEITHLWSRDEFNPKNGIEAHNKAIALSHKKGAALDVGCGCTGRFIDLLIEQGFQPEGLDISTQMIKLAKERHPKITFYHQDICLWELPKKYTFISAWDSIWHVPLEQQVPMLDKLLAGLEKNGICIFSAGGVKEPGEHENQSMGPTVYYSSLGVNGFLKVIKEADCELKHFEFDQYPELHTYYIVQKNEG